MDKFSSVDQYIASFPELVQELLSQMRMIIREAAPEASECIAYNMPSYKLNGNLVHFAGYKAHIGFYPGSQALEVFQSQLSGYASAKGSVQFPLNKPLPVSLVGQITRFRVEQDLEKPKRSKNKRTCPNGHSYLKSTDCPTCPVCQAESKDPSAVFARLSNPARNALLHAGIDTIEKLSNYTLKNILNLHGMGRASIPLLQELLQTRELDFKQE